MEIITEMKTKIIDTTIGKITTKLVVHKDYIESNGKWRLFWEEISNPFCGFHDESIVTGNPFFKTMKEAIEFGENKYNITATRADF
jgi:hypothetical protein